MAAPRQANATTISEHASERRSNSVRGGFSNSKLRRLFAEQYSEAVSYRELATREKCIHASSKTDSCPDKTVDKREGTGATADLFTPMPEHSSADK